MADGGELRRVYLQNAAQGNQEINIDLILEGGRPKQGIEYFGVWMDSETEVLCPFTLNPDGEADFGSGYDGADRYYVTDLLEKDITVGQRVAWTYDQDTVEYAVISLTALT